MVTRHTPIRPGAHPYQTEVQNWSCFMSHSPISNPIRFTPFFYSQTGVQSVSVIIFFSLFLFELASSTILFLMSVCVCPCCFSFSMHARGLVFFFFFDNLGRWKEFCIGPSYYQSEENIYSLIVCFSPRGCSRTGIRLGLERFCVE